MDSCDPQIKIPLLIVLSLLRKSMSTAVNFDGEVGFKAEEIEIIGTCGMLPSELASE
jgi:hypothetical protein